MDHSWAGTKKEVDEDSEEARLRASIDAIVKELQDVKAATQVGPLPPSSQLIYFKIRPGAYTVTKKGQAEAHPVIT